MNGVVLYAINFMLLAFLVLTALAIARLRDLFAAVMLASIFSLLSASFFVLMDAVDVAFTEAAVGAGISTLLMLRTISLTGRYQTGSRSSWRKSLPAMVIVLLTSALLIYGTADMPSFGSASAPIHQHVTPRYLQDSMHETGIPNVVTSVLASYRGFDTFGELVVIFTAGIGVLALLTVRRRDDEPAGVFVHMGQHTILRIVAKMLIPLILVFALYVQFHGDYGPGGGFQAGVIFASAIILYEILFGLHAAQQAINWTLVRMLAAIGVLIYGSVGIVGLLAGKGFLDYSALRSDAIAGQHLGILLVELGVGITVACVMIIIFFSFSKHSYSRDAVS
jgi:multicomponent Na+:H+ antiporter subunit B